MAVSSGARGLEAAAVVTDLAQVSDTDLSAVRDLGGPETPVLLADSVGSVLSSRLT
jgi:hypothetical protein